MNNTTSGNSVTNSSGDGGGIYVDADGITLIRGNILRIAAQVPNTTPYGASQILAITSLSLNGGAIPAVNDDGLHVAAYLGDATGNGSYSSLDAQRILRVATGLDTGLAAFLKIDPIIVGDITGNGILSSLDASRLLQEIVGIDRPEIPPLP